MKMKYEKPAIAVERFGLTQTIAQSCNVPGGGTTLGRPMQWHASTCTWKIGDTIMFLETGVCNSIPNAELVGEGDEVFGTCYNNPNGGTTIFGSY